MGGPIFLDIKYSLDMVHTVLGENLVNGSNIYLLYMVSMISKFIF